MLQKKNNVEKNSAMNSDKSKASWSISDWLLFYEGLHSVGIDMGLERVRAVWDNCHIEKIAQKGVITVAGTNGKGSACTMLSLLLRAQGFSVGTYTSPHIFEFSERIQLNLQNADDEKIITAFNEIEIARGDITLSYFEATTLAGLIVFARNSVDYAVLEVGLGGRLDAINVIDADAAMITSIGIDHEQFLGSDKSKIALEKAGIFRSNNPAVYADENISDLLLDYCDSSNIPLTRLGEDYSIKGNEITLNDRTIYLPNEIISLGNHQVRNAAGVCELLNRLGLLPKNSDNISEYLKKFSLIGRVQKIAKMPDIIVDVAHNHDAAIALADYLQIIKPSYQKIVAVIGMLNDKNHSLIFSEFENVFDTVYLASLPTERGTKSDVLKLSYDKVLTTPTQLFDTVELALNTAIKNTSENDLIICFGSFVLVSEVRKLI